MKKAIIVGVLVYLGMYYGDRGLHYIYFNFLHDFSTSSLLMIKSSFLVNFAPLIGGGVVGYIYQKGILYGFLTGIIASLLILGVRQYHGADLFFQEFTPIILFEDVFLKACICAAGGAVGEKLKR